MNIGLVIFGVYLLIMVGIGIFAAKLQKSTAAYWVADRGFGVPVLAIAILVSIMHGGTIIGGTGAIAARGATRYTPSAWPRAARHAAGGSGRRHKYAAAIGMLHRQTYRPRQYIPVCVRAPSPVRDAQLP